MVLEIQNYSTFKWKTQKHSSYVEVAQLLPQKFCGILTIRFLWKELLTSICRGCPVAEGRLNHWVNTTVSEKCLGKFLTVIWEAVSTLECCAVAEIAVWEMSYEGKMRDHASHCWKRHGRISSSILVLQTCLINHVFYECVLALSQDLIFFLHTKIYHPLNPEF